MKRLLLVHHPGTAFTNPNLESFIQYALSQSIKIDIRCKASLAPKPSVRNLTWLEYGRFISNIKNYFLKKNTVKPIIWIVALYEVIFVFKKKYDLIIGVDREGLIDAGLYSHFLKIPYVYFSYEIMFSDEIGNSRKRLERKYSANVKLWMIQDETRAKCLVEENNLNLNDCFLLPIASAGTGEYSELRLRDALGIDESKKVAIMIGSLSEWSMSYDIIQSVNNWPEDWVLIIHERYGRTKQLLIDRIGSNLFGTRIVCSDAKAKSLDGMGSILAGIEVGLAFYRAVYTTPYNGKNIKYIGLSSGKIATYLRYGIPVLTNRIGQYADIIRNEKLGIVVESPHEIGSALAHLERSDYSGRCIQYFSDYLDANIFMPSLLNKLKEIN